MNNGALKDKKQCAVSILQEKLLEMIIVESEDEKQV